MDLIEANIGDLSILRNQIDNPRLCIVETHGEIIGNKHDVAKNSQELIDFCNNNNIMYLAYNPSNNGTQVTQKIEDVKFSKRVEDLKDIIEYIEKTYHCQVILLGSSLGGFISMDAAARNVCALIINCGVIRPEEALKILAGNDFNNWEQKGSLNLLGVELPYSFYEDIASLSLEKVLQTLNVPVLWFHGTNDSLAPIKYVQEVALVNPKLKLVEVKNGGHRFGEFMEPGEWEGNVEKFILDQIPF